MDIVVRKFDSFDEADDADYEYYRALSRNEKLQILLELIIPETSDAAVIERSARVHPLTEHQECYVRDCRLLGAGSPDHEFGKKTARMRGFTLSGRPSSKAKKSAASANK